MPQSHQHTHDIMTTSHSMKLVNRHQLQWAIGLSAGMMFIEIAGGLWTHSLALLSDAFHMFTHIFALVVSYIAVRLSEKPANQNQSFGYHRAETLAAVINGVFLVFVTLFIIYEAIERFFDIKEIEEVGMLVIASAGFIINLITASILMKADRHNLNIRGAFLHMIGDAASSVGVIIAGVIIFYTKWYYLDPIISIVIAIVIVFWAFGLLRDSVRVLMESTPKHIDVEEVNSHLMEKFSTITEIHDIHIWEIAQRLYIFSAHIVLNDIMVSEAEKLGERMSRLLLDKFNISHTNFQFETGNSDICQCHFQSL